MKELKEAILSDGHYDNKLVLRMRLEGLRAIVEMHNLQNTLEKKKQPNPDPTGGIEI
jgi:hypothetical protein